MNEYDSWRLSLPLTQRPNQTEPTRIKQGKPKPGGQGRGRRAQRLTERPNGDGGSEGPRGHPTPPQSRVGLQNSNSISDSMEGVGVGGQKRSGAGGGDSEEHLLEQQQMWKEVSVIIVAYQVRAQ